MISDYEVLFGNRITGGAESLANDPVGIEVNLPVMIGMAIGAHGEHRAVEIKLEDFESGAGSALTLGILPTRSSSSLIASL